MFLTYGTFMAFTGFVFCQNDHMIANRALYIFSSLVCPRSGPARPGLSAGDEEGEDGDDEEDLATTTTSTPSTAGAAAALALAAADTLPLGASNSPASSRDKVIHTV